MMTIARWTMNWIKVGFTGFCALSITAACVDIDSQDTVQLFSEEDAKALRLTEADIRTLSAQSKDFSQGGPGIKIIYPEVTENDGSSRSSRIEFMSPASLDIEFQQNLAPIDFGTLDVRGKKFGFSKSITEHVRPFLDGNLILARNLDLPKGKFLIEFEIQDVEGRSTTRGYFIESR